LSVDGGSEAAEDRYLPDRSDFSREVGTETFLANNPLDLIGRMDVGAHRLSERAQDEVHHDDDEPHEARVAQVDEAVEVLSALR